MGTCSEDHTFEELRSIVEPIAREYGMKRVSLFGSRARGDNSPGSDYDFCVLTDEECGMFELAGFFLDLRDAIGNEIDLVCEDELEEDFSRTIHRDMRLLYEI